MAQTPKRTERVAILTGGGDAPGLNAVLRAFVRVSHHHGIEVYGSEDGFEGLVQRNRMVKLTPGSVRGILARGGSILGCSNRANPFAYPTGTESDPYEDRTQDVVERLRSHGIDILVLVGGDGTMDIGHRLSQQHKVPVVGIPKTIDNDLGATDVTFGFDTAVTTATWAIDTLHSTAEAHDRIMIVEVMGRYAGWIALHSGMAGGADIILLPERPYDIERVATKIRQRAQQGSTFSIVVVGEGAYPKGTPSTEASPVDGHLPKLQGAAATLAQHLGAQVPHEIRTTVLGHLQRGGSPSPADRILGTRFGAAAADLCAKGITQRMVSIRNEQIVDVALKEAVQNPKRVTDSEPLIATAKAIGIEFG